MVQNYARCKIMQNANLHQVQIFTRCIIMQRVRLYKVQCCVWCPVLPLSLMVFLFLVFYHLSVPHKTSPSNWFTAFWNATNWLSGGCSPSIRTPGSPNVCSPNVPVVQTSSQSKCPLSPIIFRLTGLWVWLSPDSQTRIAQMSIASNSMYFWKFVIATNRA